jgi:very-short-patch-repair endonuclease
MHVPAVPSSLSARAMRLSPTLTERILWEYLKGSRLGVAFRRQVPVALYIADFCAPSKKLVVEVDGGYHKGRVKADARRDRRLARLGYRVVRIPDEMVLHHLEKAVARIRQALGP